MAPPRRKPTFWSSAMAVTCEGGKRQPIPSTPTCEHQPTQYQTVASEEQGTQTDISLRGGGRILSSEFWDPKAMNIFFVKLVPGSDLPVLTILDFFKCHSAIHLHACGRVRHHSHSSSMQLQ